MILNRLTCTAISYQLWIVAKCICANCKMYLCKLQNVFVRIAKCICANCQMYLWELQNVFDIKQTHLHSYQLSIVNCCKMYLCKLQRIQYDNCHKFCNFWKCDGEIKIHKSCQKKTCSHLYLTIIISEANMPVYINLFHLKEKKRGSVDMTPEGTSGIR